MHANINREGESIRVSITVTIPHFDDRVFSLEWNCGSEVYAGLLTEAIRKQTQDTLEDIRRRAYEDGWKDAKGKRRKQNHFSGCW